MIRDWRAKHRVLAAVIDSVPGVGLVAVAILFSIQMVNSAAEKGLSELELALFQALSLGLGLAGSFWIGQKTVRAATEDVIRPHARSAFRRVLSLYQAFGRLSASVEDRRSLLRRIGLSREGEVPLDHVEAALDLLAVQVTEQIGTANDAMDDWRDLVPDDVAKVEAKAAADTTGARAAVLEGSGSADEYGEDSDV